MQYGPLCTIPKQLSLERLSWDGSLLSNSKTTGSNFDFLSVGLLATVQLWKKNCSSYPCFAVGPSWRHNCSSHLTQPSHHPPLKNLAGDGWGSREWQSPSSEMRLKRPPFRFGSICLKFFFQNEKVDVWEDTSFGQSLKARPVKHIHPQHCPLSPALFPDRLCPPTCQPRVGHTLSVTVVIIHLEFRTACAYV